MLIQGMPLPNESGLQRRLAYGDIIRRRHFGLSQRISRQVTTYNDYEELLNLPTVKVGATLKYLVDNTHLEVCDKSMMCVVCQDETAPLFDIVRRLGCEHIFHAKCIDRWLVENHKCPLCNKSVTRI